MYVYMCECAIEYACMCVRVVCVCMYVCVCVCMSVECVCMYVCVCVCMYVCVYVCIHLLPFFRLRLSNLSLPGEFNAAKAF